MYLFGYDFNNLKQRQVEYFFFIEILTSVLTIQSYLFLSLNFSQRNSLYMLTVIYHEIISMCHFYEIIRLLLFFPRFIFSAKKFWGKYSERIWVFHCRYSIRKKTRVIKSLHHNAESCIKWAGSTSDCFKVGMGSSKEISLTLISINYISTHYQTVCKMQVQD